MIDETTVVMAPRDPTSDAAAAEDEPVGLFDAAADQTGPSGSSAGKPSKRKVG